MVDESLIGIGWRKEVITHSEYAWSLKIGSSLCWRGHRGLEPERVAEGKGWDRNCPGRQSAPPPPDAPQPLKSLQLRDAERQRHASLFLHYLFLEALIILLGKLQLQGNQAK